MPCKNAINAIILLIKFFVYKCKMVFGLGVRVRLHNPDFAGVQSYFKFHYN